MARQSSATGKARRKRMLGANTEAPEAPNAPKAPKAPRAGAFWPVRRLKVTNLVCIELLRIAQDTLYARANLGLAVCPCEPVSAAARGSAGSDSECRGWVR